MAGLDYGEGKRKIFTLYCGNEFLKELITLFVVLTASLFNNLTMMEALAFLLLLFFFALPEYAIFHLFFSFIFIKY